LKHKQQVWLIIRLPPPPPFRNPTKSKEAQKPVRNSGFFVDYCPKGDYVFEKMGAWVI
jgi:hypothetical protein